MHSLDLILMLAGGFGAALIFGLLTHRVGLSPIVGYLLAGVLLGPYTPGFIANSEIARQLAEVGVILLLFGVGLQFHLHELIRFRRIALPASAGLTLLATVLGAVVGHSFGFAWLGAIVFGIALSITSTVVLVSLLAERRELHTPVGSIGVAWLVVEDIFTVLVLIVLPSLVGSTAPADIMLAVGLGFVKLAVLVAVAVVVGGRAIPWLLTRVATTHSRELFTLAVLATALTLAVGAAELFGASMALGAFLAGMIVGRSDFASRAATEALPMRDAFAVLFFVSVGMLFDPSFLLEKPWLVAATLAVVLFGKPVIATIILLALRQSPRQALALGIGRGQIGEFSFIVGALGQDLGILSRDASSALVAASIGSISLNPLLLRLVPSIVPLLPQRAIEEDPRLRISQAPPPASNRPAHHRAVVVGYGPVGQTLCRLLAESSIETVVVELNIETVRELRARGTLAVYGDISRKETLEEAGVAKAVSLFLTAPIEVDSHVVRVARELNPELFVVARCSYLREVDALKLAGADAAFSGEGEVALAMTEFMLTRLGATPDQIDHERERIHQTMRSDVG
ncbi:MAG: cation:proton antiporter [Polyangiaceae bacterium]|nr:cation:proton antiporter [Polyangiaceae bacterium]